VEKIHEENELGAMRFKGADNDNLILPDFGGGSY